MIARGRRKIVLLGMMSRIPVAGVVWQTLHYLVGLQRLGYDVYYVEAHARAPTMLMHSSDDDGVQAATAFISQILARFDLDHHWAYQALHTDGNCYGMSDTALRALYDSADLLINLHGGTLPRPEHVATNRLVYLETDPVQLQIELHDNVRETTDFLSAHCAFFTFAENLGRPMCPLPTNNRFQFRTTRQPVVMGLWNVNGSAPSPAQCRLFTTIGNWRQPWRDITFRGEVYHWSKHYEFEKVIDLPKQTPQQFELSLGSVDDASRRMLESNGWHVRPAMDFSMDMDAYRNYIHRSRGEFTVAKDQNVRLRTGWFSDRSATYLAAGKPVITQETGFSDVLPTGQGLFGFSTLQDIVHAVDEINRDYSRHCRAARELASEYFRHDLVLPQMLQEVGL